jgi:uncharacterized protein
MESFFSAIALVFIIEGLLPFISPKRWKDVFTQVLKMPDGQIRNFGLVSIIIGLILLWVVR